MALKHLPQGERLLQGLLQALLSDSADTMQISNPPASAKLPTYVELDPDDATKKETVRIIDVSGNIATIERGVFNGGIGKEHLANAVWKQKFSSQHWLRVVDSLENGFLLEDPSYTITRNSATQFQIEDVDLTTYYTTGRIVRFNQSLSSLGVIDSASYTGGHTVVDLSSGTVPDPLTAIEIAIGPNNGFDLIASSILIDEDDMASDSATKAPSQQSVKAYVDAANPKIEGVLMNGKIVPSVTSNNLTLALKGMDGNDPSASNPVKIIIAGTLHTITSALSVTKNAGTNWFNAGSSELATKEIDYFAYIGYNATDGVTLGFSRIPHARIYSDFSTTTTDEKYCAISTITNAAAGDNYVNIGRFAATLSAGAGYTWTVPTFTSINLIQFPIYETRWLDWVPTYVWTAGTAPSGAGANIRREYKISRNTCTVNFYHSNFTAGATVTKLKLTMPFNQSGTLSDASGHIWVNADIPVLSQAWVVNGGPGNQFLNIVCTSGSHTGASLYAQYKI